MSLERVVWVGRVGRPQMALGQAGNEKQEGGWQTAGTAFMVFASCHFP